MFEKITDYLKKVKAELDKVAWPTRQELANSTGVVLTMVLICTAFLGFVDYLLFIVITRILGL
jgi:preprotein translocase SecE subunit